MPLIGLSLPRSALPAPASDSMPYNDRIRKKSASPGDYFGLSQNPRFQIRTLNSKNVFFLGW
jgi:hypothetical protein